MWGDANVGDDSLREDQLSQWRRNKKNEEAFSLSAESGRRVRLDGKERENDEQTDGIVEDGAGKADRTKDQ